MLEIAFWLVALSTIYLLPGRAPDPDRDRHPRACSRSRSTCILGYAGIISLGHAAFFGFGAYAAGLLAKHEIINEPLLALLASGVPRPCCSVSSPASWCCAART